MSVGSKYFFTFASTGSMRFGIIREACAISDTIDSGWADSLILFSFFLKKL
jgi:hypothetical protein